MTTQNIAGKNVSREIAFEISKDIGNVVINGKMTVDQKTSYALDEIVTLSGIRCYVKDIQVNYTPGGITTELSLSGEVGRLLRKAPEDDIVYASMSQDESSNFDNVSRATVKAKLADQFGRGGWTNLSILQDLCSILSLTLVTDIYEYWIRQFEVSSSTPIIEAIQSLVSFFKPKVMLFKSVLYVIDQKSTGVSWGGSVNLKSNVESVTQRDSLTIVPSKIRLTGGQGPFSTSRYEGSGSLHLGHRTGTVQVGSHTFPYDDWGTDVTETTETTGDELETNSKVEFSTSATTRKVFRTVTKQTWGKDIFGNKAYMRYETMEKYQKDADGEKAEQLVESSQTFNDYEYTHWRYTQPRLIATYKASGKRVYNTARITDGTQPVSVFDNEATFEEEIFVYETRKARGRLLKKLKRVTGDILSHSIDSTSTFTHVALANMQFEPPPEFNSEPAHIHEISSPYTGWEIKAPDNADGSEGDTIYYVLKKTNRVIHETHTIYSQMGKKKYQVETIETKLNENIALPVDGYCYTTTRSVQQVTGDAPTSPVKYRTAQIWAELDVGGEGPVAEISNGNIIDWDQADSVLDEVAWQFTTSKRFTNVELIGELPVDVGMRVVNNGITHSASGTVAASFGTNAYISAYSRKKDARSGSLTTSLTIEGEI